jgi:hypothetical protein
MLFVLIIHLFNRPPTQSDLFLSYHGIALTTAAEQKAVEPFDTNSNVASVFGVEHCS